MLPNYFRERTVYILINIRNIPQATLHQNNCQGKKKIIYIKKSSHL